MKMTPDTEMSDPACDQSKGIINDVLNQKEPEPVEEPEPEVIAPLLLKEIIADEDVFNDVPPPEKRPKKKVSEKQLEHLAKAREKAKETRRLKAEAKRDLKIKHTKIEQEPPKPEADIMTKDNPMVSATKKEYPSFQQFTPEDIIKLQEDAINSYDKKRKARKEIKKQKQQVEAVEKKNYEAVTRAIHHPVNPQADDPWSLCFN